jgi:hypothetical protein
MGSTETQHHSRPRVSEGSRTGRTGRAPRGRVRPRAATLGVLVALLGACRADAPPPANLAEQGRGIFGSGVGEVDTDPRWSIVLVTIAGDTRVADAQAALDWARSRGGLREAELSDRGKAIAVVCGRYESIDSPKARRDLERIRAIEVDGTRPFSRAGFLPPSTVALRGHSEYDLGTAKARYGEWALYTLQVGVYSREDRAPTAGELAEIRRTAEEAAHRLRSEGELAFYWHGPNRSMVTVGIFGSEDFDPHGRPGYESAVLREARERHPYNLLNGRAYRVRGRLQPSGLVMIPEE